MQHAGGPVEGASAQWRIRSPQATDPMDLAAPEAVLCRHDQSYAPPTDRLRRPYAVGPQAVLANFASLSAAGAVAGLCASDASRQPGSDPGHDPPCVACTALCGDGGLHGVEPAGVAVLARRSAAVALSTRCCASPIDPRCATCRRRARRRRPDRRISNQTRPAARRHLSLYGGFP